MAKAPAKAVKKKSFKKREKKVVPHGVVHIQATFNNTIITISDPMGNVVSWSSSGSLGFRGSRKGTPFAAQQASLTAANKAKEAGVRSVEVRVSGPGAGRESAVRALARECRQVLAGLALERERLLDSVTSPSQDTGIDLRTTTPADFPEFLGPGRSGWSRSSGTAGGKLR